MKKLSLGMVALAAVSSFALVSAAVAADMPRKEPPVDAGPVGKLPGKYPVGKYPAAMPVKAAPLPVYYDWSGLYLGFNLGGAWYNFDRTYPAPLAPLTPGTTFSASNSDFVYGFHAGVQGQWGAWVLGVEVAYSGCGRECQSFAGLTAPPFGVNLAAHNKITNYFTAGPRLGYAWDRWMIYATGGYAFATLKGSYTSTVTGLEVLCPPAQTLNFCGSSFNDGWYVGGGFDWMIHKGTLVDVIVGAEYQHIDVSTRRAFTDLVAPPAFPNSFDQSARIDIARARLTIKTHGWDIFYAPAPAPVVTK